MALDVDEIYDKIYRYCFFRLNNRETAEDITQETFLRFFSSDAPQEKTEALKYLYTVARNLCIDEYRRIKPETLKDDTVDKRFSDVNNNLRDALYQLSEEDRELIMLRYANEVSLKVLSEIYGVSRFIIHRRIQRILKTLRELM